MLRPWTLRTNLKGIRLMNAHSRIQQQYRLVLAGLGLGLVIGLCGLFWLDSRLLLLCGMAVIAVSIVAGEKRIRCPACGQSIYADIAREAAFSPRGVSKTCPRCQADWTQSAADWTAQPKAAPPEDHK